VAYTDRINPVTGIILLHPLTITFVLLTTSYPVHYQIPTQFWFIILSSFILAMIFLLLQIRVGEKALQYVIFLSDVPLIGAVVYFSRGIEGMFPLLYIILIIAAAIQLYRAGAYIISMVTVIFFLGLIIVDIFRTEFPTGLVMQRFYMFSLLFLFTAILSGSLSERYRIRTEEVAKLKLTTEEIIRHLPSGIITIDQGGDIVFTNIKDEDVRSHAHLQIAKFLKDPETVVARELVIKERYYFLSCARIPDAQGALGVLQDLTDIKRLEESSRISKQTKMLAELGGSLAHEIRNPLASIKGSLEVISKSANRTIRPFVALALKESTRLNGIVTDFLNFAQFSPNRLNRVVIGDIVSEAVLEAASRFADKGISVVREGRDFCIMADPDRMKAALVNILSNAYEASGAGSAVSVKTSSAEKWGIITIRDQGHGIVKKNLPNIFSPFFTTKKGGTGLGLSISQRIVEAHNGKIEVTSVIGEGTTFRVSLPLA
jgi:two-component system sensor histidine kinase PilS (NtrC family)